jgi:hypothetical protein
MKNEASACCFIAEGPTRLRRGGDAPNSNSALAKALRQENRDSSLIANVKNLQIIFGTWPQWS